LSLPKGKDEVLKHELDFSAI